VVNPRPRQGDVWWAETEDQRRPVLIVSRDVAAAHLDVDCAASFDNLGSQPVAMLTRRIGRLDDARDRICNALAALADC
jgi:mRNA interferase MazF